MKWKPLLVALLSTGGPWLASLCLGQTPQAEPRLLVLRNGEILRGRITWAGDRYYVSSPGRQVAVRAAQVDFTSTSMETAFRRKRAAINPASIVDHNHLAEWCIRHRLWDQAAAVLVDAARVDPNHHKTDQLVQRLQLARLQAAQRPHTEHRTTPRKSTAESQNQLQRLADELPEGSVEQFANRIQPLLINGCAAAKCHGGGGRSSFRLIRSAARTQASRHVTEKNLWAVLRQIDRNAPAKSKLLAMARQPHGGAKSFAFRRRSADQAKRLTDWVMQTGVVRPYAGGQRDVRASSRGQPNRFDRFRGGLSRAAAKRQDAAQRAARTDANSSSSVTLGDDPFDPAPFNRRFFPSRAPRAKTGVPLASPVPGLSGRFGRAAEKKLPAHSASK